MKKIVLFSVRYPVTVVMIILGVLLLGYISYDKLGVDLFPDLNNPRLFIEVKAGERPPEEMERQFVENIESLSIRQSGVTEVKSVSRAGLARITVEYNWEKDMDEAFLDLQRALNTFSQNEDIDELNISRQDPNARPILVIGLTSRDNIDIDDLRKVAENYIKNELIRLDGIADVIIAGQEYKEVEIATNPYLLEAFGLTPAQIATEITNYNRNVAGGSIEEMSTKYIIKGVSIFKDLDDIANLVIAYKNPSVSGGQTTNTPNQDSQDAPEGSITNRVPVYLKDVATVSFASTKPVNITRLNQTRCLGLSIYKETKFNTVKAVAEVEKALENVEKALPGYNFEIVENQGSFISAAIWEVQESALLGITFAIIILFVFLRRIGATLIISLAIPISIVATFNLMYFNGLTLNIMTLGGLALGAGMLVDNAIVVMENIYRNRELGLSIRDSAIKGTTQVGGAIVASTITTIVVFLPIVYLHGSSGELFKDQAWTVAFSLLSSLFVAILVIPMIFATLFKDKGSKVEVKSVSLNWYGSLLEKIISVRWPIIFLSILLLVSMFYAIDKVGSEYMPNARTNEFTIELQMPEGTRLNNTLASVMSVESIIRSIADESKVTLFATAGPSITESEEQILEGENKASLKVILSDSAGFTTSSLIQRLSSVIGNIPDVKVNFLQDETALQSILGTGSAPLVIEVAGENPELISEITGNVRQIMLSDSNIFNVRSSLEEGAPQIEVVIDRRQATFYGLSVEQISSQIENKLKGTKAGQLDHEGEMKDIRIRIPEISVNELEGITLTSSNGEVPLSEVSRVIFSYAPKEIERRNQNRIASVYADVSSTKPFDKIVQQLGANLSVISTPSDYRISIEGEEKKRRESMANLTFAMILSIVLVYMVLASQFESLIHPFTILLTIPLAGVGAIFTFFFMGMALNIMAYIGIIMLVGIAVNDSIILVDAINQFKQEGLSRLQAITKAGQYRIRPILMTSFTTILALLPLTFGFGESASLRQPMALAVIGGLISSTFLTLVVIPCVYYVFDQFKDFVTPSKKTQTA